MEYEEKSGMEKGRVYMVKQVEHGPMGGNRHFNEARF